MPTLGVIVYLTKSGRHGSYGRDSMMLLRRSLGHLFDNYNRVQRDDVLLMHFGDVNRADQASVLPICHGTCRWLELPPAVRTVPSHIVRSRWVQPFRFSVGYRHMIRLFAIELWDVVAARGYEYVMRLDDESRILSPIPYNLFESMRQRNLVYGFRLASYERGHGNEFHGRVRGYLVRHSIEPRWLLHSCVSRNVANFSFDNCGDLYGFYNNFFISHVPFWRQQRVRAFLDWVNASGVAHLCMIWCTAGFEGVPR